MIAITQPDNTWRVVYQPDHAAVSADIASRWQRPHTIPQPLWDRFLHTVRHHDEGWREAERNPALDERGQPYNFKSVPTHEHLAIWRAGFERLCTHDDYAALLVMLHARWLYTHVASEAEQELAAVQVFLAELDRRIDAMINRLRHANDPLPQAVEPARLNTARRLLSLFDAMSLMLAGGLPTHSFPEPVAFHHTTERLTLEACDDGIAVDPWPFRGDAFTLQIPARQIPKRRFRNPLDLATTLRKADPLDLPLTIRPA